MGIEIEAKFRLVEPGAMRRRLVRLGARRIGRVLEENTYFDTPSGDLRRGDCGLRLRVVKPARGKCRAELTYKGPRRPGELKIRPEHQTQVASARDAADILRGLGYLPGVSFQKRRESYRLAGARVELDELPALGFFLEIEADDERTCRRVRRRLGLGDEPTVTSPYVALVSEHLAASGGGAELRFDRGSKGD